MEPAALEATITAKSLAVVIWAIRGYPGICAESLAAGGALVDTADPATTATAKAEYRHPDPGHV